MFHVEHIVPGDTIVAISTPPGEGGIALVRVSGDCSFSVVSMVFRSSVPAEDLPLRRAVHGWILDGSEYVDEVMVVYYKKPYSYTGENVAEISCHGSPYVARKIVDLLIRKGCRPASPGEFTLRAFLNGKMDLAQAEAVADMIHSKTEASRKMAVTQLEGGLSRQIRSMAEQLLNACSLLEIELDFSEEDVEFFPKQRMKDLLQSLIDEMDVLIRSYDRGRISREGIRIVLVGKPNVGKSSLLNALLEKERAIVTEMPGTTRDTVEDILDIQGVMTLITDTAGIRESDDPIEREGVSRAEQAFERSDLVLCVIDGSRKPEEEDLRFLDRMRESGKQVFLLINKSDLTDAWPPDQLHRARETFPSFSVSAATRSGIQELIGSLEETIGRSAGRTDSILLTHIRHRECLEKARESLMNALESGQKNMSQEYIALDLRGALDHLSMITGETAGDEILNRIFSKFCIGK
jgi:tRNA modification GTPase